MHLKLKELRTIKGLSQQEVADSLYCSVVSYSRYETGNRSPSLEFLVQIADFYDVTLDYLMGREHISPQGLTPYEISLIDAARLADDRAKDDALQMLRTHATKSTETKT